MKYIVLLLMLLSVKSYAQSTACVYTAANASERLGFSNYGQAPNFRTGCLVVQQDTNVVYEWNGSAYVIIGPPSAGSGITSINSQTGVAQVFANDTNVVMTHSNNTHTIGWSGTLAVSRGGSGAALSPALGDIVYSDASKLVLLAAGTSGQVLKSNGAAAPSWDGAITSLNSQTGATQVFANDANVVITSSNNTHTLGWSGALSIARGGTNNGSLSVAAGGIYYADGTKIVLLPAGTSGQTLKSNGAAPPSWQ